MDDVAKCKRDVLRDIASRVMGDLEDDIAFHAAALTAGAGAGREGWERLSCETVVAWAAMVGVLAGLGDITPAREAGWFVHATEADVATFGASAFMGEMTANVVEWLAKAFALNESAKTELCDVALSLGFVAFERADALHREGVS